MGVVVVVGKVEIGVTSGESTVDSIVDGAIESIGTDVVSTEVLLIVSPEQETTSIVRSMTNKRANKNLHFMKISREEQGCFLSALRQQLGWQPFRLS